jgi:hypothetical protein
MTLRRSLLQVLRTRMGIRHGAKLARMTHLRHWFGDGCPGRMVASQRRGLAHDRRGRFAMRMRFRRGICRAAEQNPTLIGPRIDNHSNRVAPF